MLKSAFRARFKYVASLDFYRDPKHMFKSKYDPDLTVIREFLGPSPRAVSGKNPKTLLVTVGSHTLGLRK